MVHPLGLLRFASRSDLHYMVAAKCNGASSAFGRGNDQPGAATYSGARRVSCNSAITSASMSRCLPEYRAENGCPIPKKADAIPVPNYSYGEAYKLD